MGCTEKIRELLSAGHLFLADLVFPKRCLSCADYGYFLCPACALSIPLNREQQCPVCRKKTTPFGRPCFECAPGSDLDALLVAAPYSHPALKTSIHAFKYRFVDELAANLADLAVATLKSSEMPLPELIVPVPLHSRRLRWRGFNQSALLARHISKNLAPGICLDLSEDLLKRNRYTAPQVSLSSRKMRLANIAGAFSLNDIQEIKNKTILLIDDVTTTTSTLQECAKVLKSHGAFRVYATVLARNEALQNTPTEGRGV